MVSDRLRTMLGSRRSAIAFCWASPPQTGQQAWEEAPGAAPGQGLSCEQPGFFLGGRHGREGSISLSQGPVSQSTCGLTPGDMRWARSDETRCN